MDTDFRSVNVYGRAMSPFDAPGVWLRCALHAHTTNSDGELAPEFLVRHYDWAGYDVLAITDHWVRTAEPSTKTLLVIPSTELNAVVGDGGRSTSSPSASRPTRCRPRAVRAARRRRRLDRATNGGLPYIAHTYWSGLRTEQWWDCPGLLGLEVWNTGCELELGRGDASIHWDEALEHGRPFQALATDDSHHPGYDSGFAWTWVRARRALAGRRCSTRCARAVLRLDRPRDPRRRGLATTRSSCAAAPRERSRSTAAAARRARERRPARLSEPSRVLERDDDGLITHARLQRPYGGAYGRVEVTTPQRHEGLDEPAVDRVAAIERSARAVRPARGRRRDHRRGDRRGGDGARARRRARRPRATSRPRRRRARRS